MFGTPEFFKEQKQNFALDCTSEKGTKVLGEIAEPDRAIIQSVFTRVKHEIDVGNKDEIVWINLFLNNTKQVADLDVLHDFVWRTVNKVCLGWPEKHIVNYGFLYNPAKSQKYQKFHLDYSFTSSTIFIPLTKVSSQNAPQFLTHTVSKVDPDHFFFYNDEEQILKAEGLTHLEVHQVVCGAFSLIQMLPGTVHRGIGNSDTYDRILFWITVDTHPYSLPETKNFKESNHY